MTAEELKAKISDLNKSTQIEVLVYDTEPIDCFEII